jgi:hypothetical protein
MADAQGQGTTVNERNFVLRRPGDVPPEFRAV